MKSPLLPHRRSIPLAAIILTAATLHAHPADNIPPFLHTGPSLTQAPEAAIAHVKNR